VVMLRFAKVATSATRIPVRSLAKKAVPKAAASGPQTSASAPADLTAVVHGLNIMKEGADPAIRPDSEYPEWVWTLHKPLPTLEDLKVRYAAEPDAMSDEDKRRLIRQWNRKRIKDANKASKKK